MTTTPWYDVLLAARRVHGRDEPLTSSTLALESGIDVHIASAWLFKFEKWNYVLRGDKQSTGRRWSWSWVLTRWGLEMERASSKRATATKKFKLKVAANPKKK